MARPSNWNHLGGAPKVGTTLGVLRRLEGRRLSGRLGWQFELELVEEELEFGLRLGVAGDLDLAPVGVLGVRPEASAASRLARVACRQ
jgi:hypothetical protein